MEDCEGGIKRKLSRILKRKSRGNSLRNCQHPRCGEKEQGEEGKKEVQDDILPKALGP